MPAATEVAVHHAHKFESRPLPAAGYEAHLTAYISGNEMHP